MKMESYLKEIEFAVSQTFASIWHEHTELEKIRKDMVYLFNHNWKNNTGTEIPIGNWHKVLVTGHLPSHFISNEEKLLYKKRDDENELRLRIMARQFSSNALSGAILQFAKKGISLAHGKLDNCQEEDLSELSL